MTTIEQMPKSTSLERVKARIILSKNKNSLYTNVQKCSRFQLWGSTAHFFTLELLFTLVFNQQP